MTQKRENPVDDVEVVEGEIEMLPTPAEKEADMIERAEQYAERYQKIMSIAIGMTTYKDWVKQGDSPYLTHSGAEKIKNPFGLSLYNFKTWKVMSRDEDGDYFQYVTSCTIRNRHGDVMELEGTCSQRSKFHGLKKGVWRELRDLDEMNIRKHSRTNCIRNAITHFIGLRNPTWEELRKAGVDVDKIASVDYKVTDKTDELMDDVLLKRKEIEHMIGEMTNNDKDKMAEHFIHLTKFKTYKGQPDIKRWTEKQITFTLAKVKKAYDEFVKSQIKNTPDNLENEGGGDNEEVPTG